MRGQNARAAAEDASAGSLGSMEPRYIPLNRPPVKSRCGRVRPGNVLKLSLGIAGTDPWQVRVSGRPKRPEELWTARQALSKVRGEDGEIDRPHVIVAIEVRRWIERRVGTRGVPGPREGVQVGSVDHAVPVDIGGLDDSQCPGTLSGAGVGVGDRQGSRPQCCRRRESDGGAQLGGPDQRGYADRNVGAEVQTRPALKVGPEDLNDMDAALQDVDGVRRGLNDRRDGRGGAGGDAGGDRSPGHLSGLVRADLSSIIRDEGAIGQGAGYTHHQLDGAGGSGVEGADAPG